MYLAIIRSQGDQSVGSVTPWAATCLVCVVLGVTASFVDSPRSRSLLFAAAAGTMVGVGFLAIFSIGLLLILSGALFALAASRVPLPRPRDPLIACAVGIGACIVVPAALLTLS